MDIVGAMKRWECLQIVIENISMLEGFSLNSAIYADDAAVCYTFNSNVTNTIQMMFYFSDDIRPEVSAISGIFLIKYKMRSPG